jgi:hypothetical protein
MKIKVDHYQQGESKHCVLYSVANAINDYHPVSLADNYPDGGLSWKDVNKVVETYDYNVFPIYYSGSDKLHVKDSSVYYDSIQVINEEIEERDFTAMLIGLKGGKLNHYVCLLHLSKLNLFVEVDSMHDYCEIFTDLDTYLNKRKVFEFSFIEHEQGLIFRPIDFDDEDSLVNRIINEYIKHK